VEYAGTEAIYEVARLLAKDGQLTFLLHNQTGSIHRECEESLGAIVELRNSGFVPCAIEMFSAGFEAVRGADRAAYELAAKKLAPAIEALESIMKQYGQDVAGDTISRLYNDVGQIHQRMQHYEPAEVLNWLNAIDGELDAYAERMSSMHQAALDSTAFEQIVAGLRDQQFTIEGAEPLRLPGHDLPLAWILIARR